MGLLCPLRGSRSARRWPFYFALRLFVFLFPEPAALGVMRPLGATGAARLASPRRYNCFAIPSTPRRGSLRRPRSRPRSGGPRCGDIVLAPIEKFRGSQTPGWSIWPTRQNTACTLFPRHFSLLDLSGASASSTHASRSAVHPPGR